MNTSFQKYPEIQEYLRSVSNQISSRLDVKSIILFGGLAIDDFSKKYSDIDIVIVLEEKLDGGKHRVVEQIIKDLQEENQDYTQQLYVYFIPIAMIERPAEVFSPMDGSIYGNGRMRPMKQYPLSMIDDFSIREKGKVLYGEDLRSRIPEPPNDCHWRMFIDSLPLIEQAVDRHPFQPGESNDHSTVSWLLYFPRLLYSLINSDIIGKSDSAFWFRDENDTPLSDFLVDIATRRKENLALDNNEELVLNSRKLVLYTLQRILEIKGKHTNIYEGVVIESEKFDFTSVFGRFKSCIST